MGALVTVIQGIQAECTAKGQNIFPQAPEKDTASQGERARYFSLAKSEAKPKAVAALGSRAQTFCATLAKQDYSLTRPVVEAWIAKIQQLNEDFLADEREDWDKFWGDLQDTNTLSAEQVARYQTDILRSYRFASALLAHTDENFEKKITKPQLDYIQTLNTCMDQCPNNIFEHFVLDRRKSILDNITPEVKRALGKLFEDGKNKNIVKALEALIEKETATMREALKADVKEMLWAYALFHTMITGNTACHAYFEKQTEPQKQFYFSYAYYFAIEHDDAQVLDTFKTHNKITKDNEKIADIMVLRAHEAKLQQAEQTPPTPGTPQSPTSTNTPVTPRSPMSPRGSVFSMPDVAAALPPTSSPAGTSGSGGSERHSPGMGGLFFSIKRRGSQQQPPVSPSVLPLTFVDSPQEDAEELKTRTGCWRFRFCK